MDKGLYEENEPKGELNPDSMQPIIWDEAQRGYTKQEELKERVSKRLNRNVDIAQLNRNIMSMRKKGFDIREYKLNLRGEDSS